MFNKKLVTTLVTIFAVFGFTTGMILGEKAYKKSNTNNIQDVKAYELIDRVIGK